MPIFHSDNLTYWCLILRSIVMFRVFFQTRLFVPKYTGNNHFWSENTSPVRYKKCLMLILEKELELLARFRAEL